MPKDGNKRRAAATAEMLNLTSLYSAEAEKAVLGCMVAQPGEVIDQAAEELVMEDFFVSAHQEIFQAMLGMATNGVAIDVMTIHQWLHDRKLAETVGSPGILAELLVGFATHLNVGSYIKIVKDKSLLRAAMKACSETVADIYDMPDSVSSVLDRMESRVMAVSREGESSADNVPTHVVMDKLVERITTYTGKYDVTGIPSGFHKLDRLTGGWQRGQMIVLAARPGMGKTGLALGFARAAVKSRWDNEHEMFVKPGYPVGIFSLEMPTEQLVARNLAAESSIDLQRIIRGLTDEHERQKVRMIAADMKPWPLFIRDPSYMTITQARSKARRMKADHGIEMLIIDYLQLMTSPSEQGRENRQNEVAEISRGVKALAKELAIPVIILAQLNRRSDEQRGGKAEPALHNLRESGAIEQDADTVMLLHRPELEPNEDGTPREFGPIINYSLNVAKQRNGPTDKLEIMFNAPYARFDDPIRHETRTI